MSDAIAPQGLESPDKLVPDVPAGLGGVAMGMAPPGPAVFSAVFTTHALELLPELTPVKNPTDSVSGEAEAGWLRPSGFEAAAPAVAKPEPTMPVEAAVPGRDPADQLDGLPLSPLLNPREVSSAVEALMADVVAESAAFPLEAVAPVMDSSADSLAEILTAPTSVSLPSTVAELPAGAVEESGSAAARTGAEPLDYSLLLMVPAEVLFGLPRTGR